MFTTVKPLPLRWDISSDRGVVVLSAFLDSFTPRRRALVLLLAIAVAVAATGLVVSQRVTATRAEPWPSFTMVYRDATLPDLCGPHGPLGPIFNSRYMAEALASGRAEEISLELNGPLAPCLLRPVGDDRYLHVLMPIRMAS